MKGEGVGDDNMSWAVDLCRHVKWHKTEDTPHHPYAPAVTWGPGGVVQCWLDLENSVMEFGYSGESLGSAFEGFIVGSGGLFPAVSSHLENECKFNFGNEPFKYPPSSQYLPLKLTNFAG